MLRLRPYLSKSAVSLTCKRGILCRYMSSVENAVASETLTRIRLVRNSIANIDDLLSIPRYNMVDSILRNIERLVELQTKVPVVYCEEAARLLGKRHDLISMGRLIAAVNHSYGQGTEECTRIVFYCIGQMVINGNVEEALAVLQTYLHARQEDYLSLLDTISSFRGSYSFVVRPIVDFCHSKAVDELWNQNLTFNVKLLQAYHALLENRHLVENEVINIAWAIDERWKEITDIFPIPSVELIAAKTQCAVAVSRRFRMLAEKASGSSSQIRKYSDLAGTHCDQLMSLVEDMIRRGDQITDQATQVMTSKLQFDSQTRVKQLMSTYFHPDVTKTSSDRPSVAASPDLSLVNLIRSTVLDFAVERALQGQGNQAFDLLERFIYTTQLVKPSDSGEIKPRTKLSYPLQVKKGPSSPLQNVDLKATIGAVRLATPVAASTEMDGGVASSSPSTAASSLKNSDREWIEMAVGSILKNYRHSDQSRVVSTDGAFKDLQSVLDSSEILSQKLGIPLNSAFYASFIDSLGVNVVEFNKTLLRKADTSEPLVDWHTALHAAQQIVKSLPSAAAQSSEVYHALIHLLCRFQDPQAFIRAIQFFQEMSGAGVSVLPDTVRTILRYGVFTLALEDLVKVVDEVEYLLMGVCNTSAESDLLVLHARILAHTRIGRASHARSLFNRYRTFGGKPDPALYAALLRMMSRSPRYKVYDRFVIDNPTSLCIEFMQQMHHDGLKLTHLNMNRLLGIFTKHLQVSQDRPGIVSKGLREMEQFIEGCAAGELPGTPIELNNDGFAILLKAYLTFGHEDRAYYLFQNADKFFPHLHLGIEPYEIFMFHYAVVQHNVDRCEELRKTMIREDLTPSDAILSSLVKCYLKLQRPNDALQQMKEFYSQYNLKPATMNLLHLLDYSLQEGDAAQARRVVNFIRSIYTPSERNLIVGTHDNQYLAESPSHADYEEPEDLIDLDVYHRAREFMKEYGEDYDYVDENDEEKYQTSGYRRGRRSGYYDDDDDEEEEPEETDEDEYGAYEERRAYDNDDNESMLDLEEENEAAWSSHHSERASSDYQKDVTLKPDKVPHERGFKAFEVKPAATSSQPTVLSDDSVDDMFSSLLNKRAEARRKVQEDTEAEEDRQREIHFQRRLASMTEEDREHRNQWIRRRYKQMFLARGWLNKAPIKKFELMHKDPHLPYVMGVLSDVQLEARFKKFGVRWSDK